MHPITRKNGARWGTPPFDFAQGSAPAEPRQKQDDSSEK